MRRLVLFALVLAAACSAAPPPEDPRAGDPPRDRAGRVVYFVMVDRFANGDRANDTGEIAGTRAEHGFDPTDPGYYHGGDLAGLAAGLDYVAGLGAQALWLTPVQVNRPVQGVGDRASAGYHGYWITDFTTVDPHLGSEEDLAAVVDAAHERGMKVLLDAVVNHTADVIDYAEGSYAYRPKGTDPYTPVFRSPEDATIKRPDWLNDPSMYHNRGNALGSAGESAVYGDFHGLDDLYTERPEVVAGMTEIWTDWITRFRVDGFRVDTVKHVNTEFWHAWIPAVLDHAAAEGIEPFWLLGEVWEPDPVITSLYAQRTGFPGVFDFGFQAAAVEFALSRPTTGLRALFAADDRYTTATTDAHSLATFLGNHDMGRVGHFLARHADGDELLARARLAHELLLLARGTPVVYAGDEQGFTGTGGDKAARQSLFASAVPEWADQPTIGSDATPADDNFNTEHPLYRAIRKLARLRAAYPALATGAQVHRYATDEAGVYAFSRIDPASDTEYLVALNNATSEQTVAVPTDTPGATFTRIYPDTGASTDTDDAGALRLTVPPLSAVVFEADRRLPVLEDQPAVTVRDPAGWTGRVEVAADVDVDRPVTVTFLMRLDEDDEWAVLGVDDAPPYRVYLDTTGLPEGVRPQLDAVVGGVRRSP